jgi:hypothetical protein
MSKGCKNGKCKVHRWMDKAEQGKRKSINVGETTYVMWKKKWNKMEQKKIKSGNMDVCMYAHTKKEK